MHVDRVVALDREHLVAEAATAGPEKVAALERQLSDAKSLRDELQSQFDQLRKDLDVLRNAPPPLPARISASNVYFFIDRCIDSLHLQLTSFGRSTWAR